MSTSTRASHGIKTGVDSTRAASQAQAMWRFLNNPNVQPTTLVEPLQAAVIQGCAQSQSAYVLVMHDWCKVDFKRHRSKKDLLQVTHKHDIGYDLTASLAVEADQGIVLAPLALQLKTSKQLHSTCQMPPKRSAHHLNQLQPIMKEVAKIELGRTPVHIIDREGDSLGHFRNWVQHDFQFLVRCDDRRVTCQGESVLLSQINEKLNEQVLFEDAGEAQFQGKSVQRQVAEVSVVLDGVHRTREAGKQKEIRGQALTLRAVFVRLVDKRDYILAEWMLLTNVSANEVDAATLGQWYYYRWRIESYFKLLKSAGHELEYWQQETGKAILCRLLVASMACVYIWQLQRDKSQQAATLRGFLMKLSGRQTKYGVESTTTALLSGWYTMMAMLNLIQTTDVSLQQLNELAKIYAPP